MAAPSRNIKIGKYDVIDTIGRGGMGVVYLAKDPDLDRLVAIKMMNIDAHESDEFLKRFKQEARTTARLEHPNIVAVYESGEHQGRPFLVMPYLEGNSLELLLREHRSMSPLEKLNIIIEVCQGLSYAHQHGIIHRDIKPANIMVLNDGSVKIVDFGIARLGDNTLTRPGQFVGTLSYMPPEQFRDMPLDARADIYSTGVVLYQLLTNSLPFQGESTGSTVYKIISDEPPPFRQFGVSCPAELEAITLKALSKNRDLRYATAEAFGVDIAEVQDRLKQTTISEYLDQAELLQQSNELLQAQEYLLKVLKLDRQHTTASRLLSAVRSNLKAQVGAERGRQLKQQAEEACERDDCEAALLLVNQALQFDDGLELQALKTRVEQAKSHADLVRKTVARAEAAQKAGDLDSAKGAIDDAYARQPADSKIRALRRMIDRDLEERDRLRKVETLLDEAQKSISAQKLTSALDLLKEAQKLDPSAPQLRELLEKLQAQHQQAKRRKELQQVKVKVQAAIDQGDYQAASRTAAEAVHNFPGEVELIKLKDLCDGQIELAVQKEFVRNQIAAAKLELDGGHTQKALDLAERALARCPRDAQLEALRLKAHERSLKERSESDRATCLQQANEAITLERFDAAIETLENTQLRFGKSPDTDKLLRFARERRLGARQQLLIDEAVGRAQLLQAEQRFEEAVQALGPAVEQVPSEKLKTLLGEAETQLESFRLDLQAALSKGKHLLALGESASAAEFLNSRPASYQQSAEFRSLQSEALAAVANAEHLKPNLAATEMFIPGNSPDSGVAFGEASSAKSAETRMFIRTDRPAESAPPEASRQSRSQHSVPSPAGKARTRQLTKTLVMSTVAAIIILTSAIVVRNIVKRNSTKTPAVIAVTPPSKSPAPTETKPATDQPRTTPSAVQSSSSAFRHITVVCNVSDFRVWVDGEDKGSSGFSKKLPIVLNEHAQKIRITRQGYQSTEVFIPGGNTLRVELPVEVSRAPTPASLGSKTQSVQPSPVDNEQKKTVADVKPSPAAPASTTPASIKVFQAIPLSINPGETATLLWQTQDATQVWLNGEKVGANDQLEVHPDKTTTYTLAVVGASGQKDDQQRKIVTVHPKQAEEHESQSSTAGPSDEAAINQARLRYEKKYEDENKASDISLQLIRCDPLQQPVPQEKVNLTCRYRATFTLKGSSKSSQNTFIYTFAKKAGVWEFADVQIK